MTNSFKQASELINSTNNILLTTHERTDGDDLGTVLSFYHYLKSINKNPKLVIRGGVPNQLKFLPGSETVTETIPKNFLPEAIIYSGCSKKSRCNIQEVVDLTCPAINLDHHPDNTMFAEINIINSIKSSVAELAYDYFKFFNIHITPDIATCMLTGIFTDTGSFMHSNTKQPTLLAAADLMKLGASLTKIAKFTYKGKSESTLKAWGRALENTYYDKKKKVIYSVMTDRDLKDLTGLPLSAFEGFVETLNKVPEAKVALFLKQDGDTIKGSLRSDPHKGVDVQKIAKILGGGGHVWASGFSILGRLERNELGKWVVSEGNPEIDASIVRAKEFIIQEANDLPKISEQKNPSN